MIIRILMFALIAAALAAGQATPPQAPPDKAPPDKPDMPTMNRPAQENRDSKDSSPPPAPKVILLPVTLRDKHGQVVKDLRKEDFTLEEDGRQQPVAYFSSDPNVPLNFGVLVDTSFGQRELLDQERNASRTFFDQMLVADKEKAFLLHFDSEVELLQDLTRNHDKMQSALELLKTGEEQSDRSRDPNEDPHDASRRHPSRQLYDALYLASNELLKKQPGRKAVIIISDGVDSGSRTTLESAIEAAGRSNTVVYAIYFKGIDERQRRDEGNSGRGGYPGGGGGGGPYPGGGRRGGGQRRSEEPKVDGKKILEKISKETGGRFFEVTKKELVGDAYTTISDGLRARCVLAFTPDKDAAGEGYHHIVLHTSKKDLEIEAPAGYYGPEEN